MKRVSEERGELKGKNDRLRKDLDILNKKLKKVNEELKVEAKAKRDALNELELSREDFRRKKFCFWLAHVH